MASSVTEGASWQWLNFFAGPIIAISLLWFFFDYTTYKKRRLGYILELYFAATTVIGLVGPVELILNLAVPMIKIIQLTPTLQIVYYEVTSGPLKIVTQACYLLSCLFCLWIAMKQYKIGKKKETIPLFLVL
nr:hypothetical protein [Candidatus Sigynarchaeota archaeon]